MKVIHVSAECYPIAKVGGLADVVGALPLYQKKSGIVSSVIMPFYNNEFTEKNKFKVIYENKLQLGRVNFDYRILTLKNNKLGLDLFLVDIPELLYTDYVYSFDDTNRFLAFQIAVLNWMVDKKLKPSIVHCHDHHTGLIPFMMQHSYNYEPLKTIPSVLTIHNAQYQGRFSHDNIHKIPKFDFDKVGLIDWDDSINPLAAAIKCAWKVNTVSPSYMEELKENANGLESLLNHEKAKCSGILNGIDTNVWNPEIDEFLIKNYKVSTVQSGKKANKKYLCNKFNLDINNPLFVFIGRLVHQKAADLLPDIFDTVLKTNEISILVLGSGTPEVEERLKSLESKKKYHFHSAYDEALSHIMYAGADFLLMPSRIEPCGLNQMYSLKYGTIPIVTKTGGLKDTVIDINEEGGFGFCHEEISISDVANAVNRAAEFYSNQVDFRKVRKEIMKINHSWDASAKEYIEFYKLLIN